MGGSGGMPRLSAIAQQCVAASGLCAVRRGSYSAGQHHALREAAPSVGNTRFTHTTGLAMPQRAHLLAGFLAPLCLATFFLSTILTELLGTHAAVAQLKALIVSPGLWIMIPAMAAAGGSGLFLGRSRKGRLVDGKKKRMRFIAANGLLVLVPCAIALDRWAAVGAFDTSFYVVQALELIAGATNFVLMALNVRDGLRMAGRLRPLPAAPGKLR
jgi:hypothetical protein